jgi:hypothetical protein
VIIRYQLTATGIESKDKDLVEPEIRDDDIIPTSVKWNMMRMRSPLSREIDLVWLGSAGNCGKIAGRL